MSDAANPAAHNTDNSETLRPRGWVNARTHVFWPLLRGHEPPEYTADEGWEPVYSRAALSAARPNDPLGRLFAWADANDAWIGFYRDPERDGRSAPNRYEGRGILGTNRQIVHAPTVHEAAAALLAALAGSPEGTDAYPITNAIRRDLFGLPPLAGTPEAPGA